VFTISNISRVLLGIVFVIAFASKIKSYDEFVYTVDVICRPLFFQLDIANMVAPTIISVEFFVGIFLVIGVYKKIFLNSAAVLIVVFSISLILLAFKNEGCNCFGNSTDKIGVVAFMRNFALLGLIVVSRKSI
jgi:uncharacterized membrane protein YphA (DoxX/SURF4 family)